jgi:hypothetical protein
MNHIVDAIRFEIARSAEKAYESLRLADTYKLFLLQNENELKQFISTNNGKGDGIEWKVNGDRLYFVKQKAEAKEIPSEKMINVSLTLATELNRIV